MVVDHGEESRYIVDETSINIAFATSELRGGKNVVMCKDESRGQI